MITVTAQNLLVSLPPADGEIGRDLRDCLFWGL